MCTCSEELNRRDALQAIARAACAMALAGFPLRRTSAAEPRGKPKRVLFFTKSGQFEHSCIRRPGPRDDARLSHAEQVLVDLGRQHGFQVVPTKDGRVFTPDGLREFDLIAFYTQGDITQPGVDRTPPITPAGKAALLDFIEQGKGFVGFHCASGTFPSADGAPPDPYTKVLGAEATWHGAQQDARLRAVGGFAPSAASRRWRTSATSSFTRSGTSSSTSRPTFMSFSRRRRRA